jgi:hypothetical protein
MEAMPSRRIHVRAPGVKTGSKIGPLGPFRGTLGIQWVIGAIAAGLIIVLVVTWILFRKPGEPYREVEEFTIDEVAPGSAREALPGIFVGVTEDGETIAVAGPPNCHLDCAEKRYGLDGVGRKGRQLVVLPVKVHRDAIFIDTSAAA